MQKNILWVEDEIKSYESFNYIAKNEFNITRACDYFEAIGLLKNNKFDLFVIDIVIPQGEKSLTIEELTRKIDENFWGLRLIERIRSMSITEPIITLTVVKKFDIINKIIEIGKPIKVLWKYDNATDAEKIYDTIISMI